MAFPLWLVFLHPIVSQHSKPKTCVLPAVACPDSYRGTPWRSRVGVLACELIGNTDHGEKGGSVGELANTVSRRESKLMY